MTGNSGSITYKKLRAPKSHGEALIEPQLSDIANLISANQSNLAKWFSKSIAGIQVKDLASRAQSKLVQQASEYTFSYREQFDLPQRSQLPIIILSGHQPELFHPGVWFKNFILSQLAQSQNAIAVNLIIDNDTITNTSIQIPVSGNRMDVSQQGYSRSSVSFDQSSTPIPWEMKQVNNHELFASFASRIESELTKQLQNPLINTVWPKVLKAYETYQNLGSSFAQARHEVEAEIGLNTLELPLSQMIDQSPAFGPFFYHLIQNRSQFVEIYNHCLNSYRQIHKIRSNSHPVPELTTDSNLAELPFWIWTKANPLRKKLFVQKNQSEIVLTDGEIIECKFSNSLDHFKLELQTLTSQGIFIRPRALMTTMFARLFLCDLFIHGIGGAKYDQLTDAIIEEFFKVSPPHFLTATATTELPLRTQKITPKSITKTRQLLRDLKFNPDRFLEKLQLNEKDKQFTASLVQQRRDWIHRVDSGTSLKERHQAISKINDELQVFLEPLRSELEQILTKQQQQLKENQIVHSREYSYVLHEQSTLKNLLLDLASPRA